MLPLLRSLRRLRAAPIAPAAGTLAPGTTFAGIRIERLLARGAAGALYLAIEEASGATLAVKALPLAAEGTAQGSLDRSAFEREACTALGLRHPGIVVVHGVATLPGLGCIVMELLPGRDLTRYTQAGRLLPEALVLEIAGGVADALSYAHRHGVVHRDVKPANVIFDPATRRVVLTDFGIARAPDAQATRSGVLLGSPAYMAPELLAGAPPDSRSDLYALGVMCFELLAGQLPFAQSSMGALLRAVAGEPPPPLVTLRPGLPGAKALDALLAPLLAKDPAERPADGAAWARQARLQGLWLSAPPAA